MVINGCEAEMAVDFRDRDLGVEEPALRRIVASDACQSNNLEELSESARGINGNCFDPSMNGQGMMLEYIEGQDRVFGNWFTFESSGERTWYALIGDYTLPLTSLDVLKVAAGMLNEPGASEPEVVGQVEIAWPAECGVAALTHTDAEGAQRTSEIVRIGAPGCPP